MESKSPNWPQIEADYRAGLKTLRQIADEHGITHGAVAKRAKRDDWTRNLAAKIKAKADALVAKSEVSKLVTKEKMVTERMTVDAGANRVADVQIRERDDVVRARNLGMTLFAELDAQTTDPDTFRQLKQTLMEVNAGEMSDAAKQRMEEAFSRVLSFSGRTTTYKALADALKTTISLEREIYRINDAPADPVTSLATAFSAAMTAANFKNLNDAELAALHGLMAKANEGQA